MNTESERKRYKKMMLEEIYEITAYEEEQEMVFAQMEVMNGKGGNEDAE